MTSRDARRHQNPRIGVLFHQGLRTGGTEALHQLVSELRRCGQDAFLVPHPLTASNPPVDAFARYECPVATLESGGWECIVLPELYVAMAQDLRDVRLFIWWLSVDNSPAFYSLLGWLAGRHGPRASTTFPRALVRSGRAPRLRRQLRNLTAEHLFQSHYAREIVRKRLGRGGRMLGDYITLPPSASARTRLQQVAYNPAKGAGFARRLRRRLPEFTFVPIRGLAPEEVVTTLTSCTVYIDTGHHPGKDRLPREASLLGCVVMVAKRGAARYEQDVPLPESFKFAARWSTREAREILRDCLMHTEERNVQQQAYRDGIAAERAVFSDQVQAVIASWPD